MDTRGQGDDYPCFMRHRAAEAAKDGLAALGAPRDEVALRAAVEQFTPVRDELFPAERAKVLRLIVGG